MPEKTGRKKTSGILNFRSPIMKTFYIFIMIMLCTSTALSQKEAYNWDYGGPYVITFNTPDGEPKILTNSIMLATAPYNLAFEGTSTISDSTGKLLFSTDGVYVYNYINNPEILLFNDGNNQSYKKK